MRAQKACSLLPLIRLIVVKCCSPASILNRRLLELLKVRLIVISAIFLDLH